MEKSLDLSSAAGTTTLEILIHLDGHEKNDALDWVHQHRDYVKALLLDKGAVLIRGLDIETGEQFSQVMNVIFQKPLLPYTNRSTPRKELINNIFSSSEYHADQIIVQHNENSYSNKWPGYIGFFCVLPSATGGETPICDSRLIYQRLPEDVVKRFESHGVMYVRNYSIIDLPWSEVFQTQDKNEVEMICRNNGMQFEWYGNNSLRTTHINQAAIMHPIKMEKVWFNQAHLFHISNLPDGIRDDLLAVVGEQGLPRNAYYGDGTPIENEVLDIVRNLYEKEKLFFKWEKGDLLILDNMLWTHGRNKYCGAREILVGMTDEIGA